MLTIIRYMEVNFTFAFVGCVRYIITRISLNRGSLIKSRFCSIHFTVILAGLKKIVRLYTEDFVI